MLNHFGEIWVPRCNVSHTTLHISLGTALHAVGLNRTTTIGIVLQRLTKYGKFVTSPVNVSVLSRNVGKQNIAWTSSYVTKSILNFRFRFKMTAFDSATVSHVSWLVDRDCVMSFHSDMPSSVSKEFILFLYLMDAILSRTG